MNGSPPTVKKRNNVWKSGVIQKVIKEDFIDKTVSEDIETVFPEKRDKYFEKLKGKGARIIDSPRCVPFEMG